MSNLIDFPHHQSAHCESGVTSNLLRFHGIECSEALAFGIGEGLFFAYMPFIKINKLPMTTFRGAVGSILGKVNKRFGVKVYREKFRSPHKAMDALDRNIERGIPTGCQTGAYWLPYFPPAFRFHFNMHNLVVFGKEGDEYIISDPVFEQPVRCRYQDLLKARYAKGTLAPNGAMYYLESVPGQPDIAAAVRQGISGVCRTMLRTPVFFIGVRGIHFLADRLVQWPKRLGEESAVLHLGQLIRMQEEIGTGGGGFRFMYAAFLQEAAQLLNSPELAGLSQQMTAIGDTWREFAVAGARICKGRPTEKDSFGTLSETLHRCAELERDLFLDLSKTLTNKPGM
jgi:hypothetical protein